MTQRGHSHIFHIDLPLSNCRAGRNVTAVQLGKTCDVCQSDQSLAAASAAMSWGHQAVGCQQGCFAYPDSNNYRGAIIFGCYYRVSAISRSRQQAEVFVHGLLHCPSPAFLHGGTLFAMLVKSSCQPQQCPLQPQRVGSFQATKKLILLSPALFVAKCLLSD